MAIYLLHLSSPTSVSFLSLRVHPHLNPQILPFIINPFLSSIFSFVQSFCCLTVKGTTEIQSRTKKKDGECLTSRNLGHALWEKFQAVNRLPQNNQREMVLITKAKEWHFLLKKLPLTFSRLLFVGMLLPSWFLSMPGSLDYHETEQHDVGSSLHSILPNRTSMRTVFVTEMLWLSSLYHLSPTRIQEEELRQKRHPTSYTFYTESMTAHFQ